MGFWFRRRILHFVTVFFIVYTTALLVFTKLSLVDRDVINHAQSDHVRGSKKLRGDELNPNYQLWQEDDDTTWRRSQLMLTKIHEQSSDNDKAIDIDNDIEFQVISSKFPLQKESIGLFIKENDQQSQGEKVNIKKIDWHDYDLIQRDLLRRGHGEQGLPVEVNPDEEIAIAAKFKDIGYNVAAGLKVSLDRAVPDLRDPNCRFKLYPESLPSVAVIIPFHNELNTTLLRTIHSLIRQSPRLLQEIILVDDASTDEDLMEPLEKYLDTFGSQIRASYENYGNNHNKGDDRLNQIDLLNDDNRDAKSFHYNNIGHHHNNNNDDDDGDNNNTIYNNANSTSKNNNNININKNYKSNYNNNNNNNNNNINNNTNIPVPMTIRLIRIPVKQGLMNARSLGATHAQADVLLFLDAHIEVGVNFLPPLVEPIAEDYRTVTNPIVGVIDNKDFRIFSNNWYAGGVSGRMNYTYFNANPKYVAKPTMPYPNPVMIGCAFAISKRWWQELEGYDPELRMWGSEQFELSFKTWMCGGSQVNVPCSRVSHLFRPRKEGGTQEDVAARENNMHRVALAWMDEYIDYVYLVYDRLLRMDPGDVSAQMRLRRKLQCKTFDWFMRNVQPEMLQIEALPKRNYVAWGKISTRSGITPKCIRVREFHAIGMLEFVLADCDWGEDGHMPEHFHYTLDGFLSTTVRKPSMCLVPVPAQLKIGLSECMKSDTNQIWSFNSVNGHLTNLITKLCVEKDNIFNSTVRLRPCDSTSEAQAWDFQYMEPNVRFY